MIISSDSTSKANEKVKINYAFMFLHEEFSTITLVQGRHVYLPITALLFAFNCRSFGILNTTFGNDKNKLCEMSKRSNCVKSANSSGNLLS